MNTSNKQGTLYGLYKRTHFPIFVSFQPDDVYYTSNIDSIKNISLFENSKLTTPRWKDIWIRKFYFKAVRFGTFVEFTAAKLVLNLQHYHITITDTLCLSNRYWLEQIPIL